MDKEEMRRTDHKGGCMDNNGEQRRESREGGHWVAAVGNECCSPGGGSLSNVEGWSRGDKLIKNNI